MRNLKKTVESLRDSTFAILNQATLPAAEFDKEAFNKIARDLLDEQESLTKQSSSKEAKRCAAACRKLLHYTIKSIKATHAKPNGKSAKAAQQSFQKSVNKFNKTFEELQSHLEKKSGKLKNKATATVTHDAARRRVSVPKLVVENPREKPQSGSPLKVIEVDKESSSDDKDSRPGTQDEDVYNNITGDYDKIVEYDAATYVPARTAVENGNLNAFIEAVEKMPGVNMQDPTDEDNSLMHWVVAYNRVDMVKVLLRRGARNLANNVGKTPLEIAKETYKSGDSSYFELNNLLIAGLCL